VLKIGDADNFRRTGAGLCLIAAPLVSLVSALITPQFTGDIADQRAAIAEHTGRWLVSEFLNLITFFMLAVLGIAHLLRHRAVVLGHVGGGLVLLGAFFHGAIIGFALVEVPLVEGGIMGDRMTEFADGMYESAAFTMILFPFLSFLPRLAPSGDSPVAGAGRAAPFRGRALGGAFIGALRPRCSEPGAHVRALLDRSRLPRAEGPASLGRRVGAGRNTEGQAGARRVGVECGQGGFHPPARQHGRSSRVNSQRATTAILADSRSAPTTAWLLCGLSLSLVACAAAFAVFTGGGVWEPVRLLALVSGALVGGMVASRRPANPVGWFLLGGAGCFATVVSAEGYAKYGLLTEPGSLPLAQAMAWPPQWLWAPGAMMFLVFLPLYFPDGRLVSPGWRWVVRFAVSFCVFAATLSAFQPGDVQGTGLVNPMGVEALGTLPWVIDAAVLPLWLGLLFVSAASQVVRFRRSGAGQRQQIKWLALAASAIPVWFVVSPLIQETVPVLFEVGETLAFAAVPVGVGIAVLKRRLYDIDLVINRTLVHAALTACVVGLYVLVVGYLGALFRTGGNLAVSLVATGLVAVLFAPLKDRVQRGVNRLMYGERDEPYAVLSRLGERLEAAVEPEAVLPAVAETVAQALKLPYAAVALKGARRGLPSSRPTVRRRRTSRCGCRLSTVTRPSAGSCSPRAPEKGDSRPPTGASSRTWPVRPGQPPTRRASPPISGGRASGWWRRARKSAAGSGATCTTGWGRSSPARRSP